MGKRHHFVPAIFAGGGIPRRIYWSLGEERAVFGEAAYVRERISAFSEAHGYARIHIEATRVDIWRNRVAKRFLEVTTDPKDTLVMLDGDHTHIPEIVQRLTRHDVGVIGALCMRRTFPHDAQFYVNDETGGIGQLAKSEIKRLAKGRQPIEGVIVGAAAIAIQRWVFDKLESAGQFYPWFRMMYRDHHDPQGGEDWYFGLACDKVGIHHYCDLTLESPHIVSPLKTVTLEDWTEGSEIEAPSRMWFEGGRG